jgi:hypothetical protein
MAAERVIIGKNCQIKVIYDNVPSTFRIEAFNENDEAELRARDFLGQDAPEMDYIEKGFTDWLLSHGYTVHGFGK